MIVVNLTLWNSVTGDGIHMVNDIVPAADTANMGMTDTATAYGVADGADKLVTLGYNITVGDLVFLLKWQKGAGGQNLRCYLHRY